MSLPPISQPSGIYTEIIRSRLCKLMMTGNRYATCALMGESTSPVSHCDAIVLVEGQMPDSFTSNVSLYMQQPRVCDWMEMIWMNSLNRE